METNTGGKVQGVIQGTAKLDGSTSDLSKDRQISIPRSYVDGRKDGTARPCAVIGPETVEHTYIRKDDVERPWNSGVPSSLFQAAFYPARNISPRQSFQENMSRIVVPSPSEMKSYPEANDINKSTMSSSKYCEGSIYFKSPHMEVLRPHCYLPPPAVDYQRYPEYAGPRIQVIKSAQMYPKVPEQNPYLFPNTSNYPCKAYARVNNMRYEPYPHIKDKYVQPPRYNYTSYPYPDQESALTKIGKFMDVKKRFGQTPDYPLSYISSHPTAQNGEYVKAPPPVPVRRSQHSIPPQYPEVPSSSHHIDTFRVMQPKLYGYNIADKNYQYNHGAKPPHDAKVNQTFYAQHNNAPLQDSRLSGDGVNNPTYNKNQPSVHSINYTPMHAPHAAPSIPTYQKPIDVPYTDRGMEYDPSYYRYYQKYAAQTAVGYNPLDNVPTQFSPNIISPADSSTSCNSVTIAVPPQSLEDGGYVSQCSTSSGRSSDPNTASISKEILTNLNARGKLTERSSAKESMRTKSDKSEKSEKKKSLGLREYYSTWVEECDETPKPHEAVGPPENTALNESTSHNAADVIVAPVHPHTVYNAEKPVGPPSSLPPYSAERPIAPNIAYGGYSTSKTNVSIPPYPYSTEKLSAHPPYPVSVNKSGVPYTSTKHFPPYSMYPSDNSNIPTSRAADRSQVPPVHGFYYNSKPTVPPTTPFMFYTEKPNVPYSGYPNKPNAPVSSSYSVNSSQPSHLSTIPPYASYCMDKNSSESQRNSYASEKMISPIAPVVSSHNPAEKNNPPVSNNQLYSMERNSAVQYNNNNAKPLNSDGVYDNKNVYSKLDKSTNSFVSKTITNPAPLVTNNVQKTGESEMTDINELIDVESRITQSIITKDIVCNYDIKPMEIVPTCGPGQLETPKINISVLPEQQVNQNNGIVHAKSADANTNSVAKSSNLAIETSVPNAVQQKKLHPSAIGATQKVSNVKNVGIADKKDNHIKQKVDAGVEHIKSKTSKPEQYIGTPFSEGMSVSYSPSYPNCLYEQSSNMSPYGATATTNSVVNNSIPSVEDVSRKRKNINMIPYEAQVSCNKVTKACSSPAEKPVHESVLKYVSATNVQHNLVDLSNVKISKPKNVNIESNLNYTDDNNSGAKTVNKTNSLDTPNVTDYSYKYQHSVGRNASDLLKIKTNSQTSTANNVNEPVNETNQACVSNEPVGTSYQLCDERLSSSYLGATKSSGEPKCDKKSDFTIRHSNNNIKHNIDNIILNNADVTNHEYRYDSLPYKYPDFESQIVATDLSMVKNYDTFGYVHKLGKSTTEVAKVDTPLRTPEIIGERLEEMSLLPVRSTVDTVIGLQVSAVENQIPVLDCGVSNDTLRIDTYERIESPVVLQEAPKSIESGNEIVKEPNDDLVSLLEESETLESPPKADNESNGDIVSTEILETRTPVPNEAGPESSEKLSPLPNDPCDNEKGQTKDESAIQYEVQDVLSDPENVLKDPSSDICDKDSALCLETTKENSDEVISIIDDEIAVESTEENTLFGTNSVDVPCNKTDLDDNKTCGSNKEALETIEDSENIVNNDENYNLSNLHNENIEESNNVAESLELIEPEIDVGSEHPNELENIDHDLEDKDLLVKDVDSVQNSPVLVTQDSEESSLQLDPSPNDQIINNEDATMKNGEGSQFKTITDLTNEDDEDIIIDVGSNNDIIEEPSHITTCVELTEEAGEHHSLPIVEPEDFNKPIDEVDNTAESDEDPTVESKEVVDRPNVDVEKDKDVILEDGDIVDIDEPDVCVDEDPQIEVDVAQETVEVENPSEEVLNVDEPVENEHVQDDFPSDGHSLQLPIEADLMSTGENILYCQIESPTAFKCMENSEKMYYLHVDSLQDVADGETITMVPCDSEEIQFRSDLDNGIDIAYDEPCIEDVACIETVVTEEMICADGDKSQEAYSPEPLWGPNPSSSDISSDEDMSLTPPSSEECTIIESTKDPDYETLINNDPILDENQNNIGENEFENLSLAINNEDHNSSNFSELFFKTTNNLEPPKCQYDQDLINVLMGESDTDKRQQDLMNVLLSEDETDNKCDKTVPDGDVDQTNKDKNTYHSSSVVTYIPNKTMKPYNDDDSENEGSSDSDSSKDSDDVCSDKKTNDDSKVAFPCKVITKAAQKYLPPLDISYHSIKCQLSLPQDKLLLLKKLSDSKTASKNTTCPNQIVAKPNTSRTEVVKKAKPKFDDVLMDIDETNMTWCKMKLRKYNKNKPATAVPKVIIKKNDQGSHYTANPEENEPTDCDNLAKNKKSLGRPAKALEDKVGNENEAIEKRSGLRKSLPSSDDNIKTESVVEKSSEDEITKKYNNGKGSTKEMKSPINTKTQKLEETFDFVKPRKNIRKVQTVNEIQTIQSVECGNNFKIKIAKKGLNIKNVFKDEDDAFKPAKKIAQRRKTISFDNDVKSSFTEKNSEKKAANYGALKRVVENKNVDSKSDVSKVEANNKLSIKDNDDVGKPAKKIAQRRKTISFDTEPNESLENVADINSSSKNPPYSKQLSSKPQRNITNKPVRGVTSNYYSSNKERENESHPKPSRIGARRTTVACDDVLDHRFVENTFQKVLSKRKKNKDEIVQSESSDDESPLFGKVGSKILKGKESGTRNEDKPLNRKNPVQRQLSALVASSSKSNNSNDPRSKIGHRRMTISFATPYNADQSASKNEPDESKNKRVEKLTVCYTDSTKGNKKEDTQGGKPTKKILSAKRTASDSPERNTKSKLSDLTVSNAKSNRSVSPKERRKNDIGDEENVDEISNSSRHKGKDHHRKMSSDESDSDIPNTKRRRSKSNNKSYNRRTSSTSNESHHHAPPSSTRNRERSSSSEERESFVIPRPNEKAPNRVNYGRQMMSHEFNPYLSGRSRGYDDYEVEQTRTVPTCDPEPYVPQRVVRRSLFDREFEEYIPSMTPLISRDVFDHITVYPQRRQSVQHESYPNPNSEKNSGRKEPTEDVNRSRVLLSYDSYQSQNKSYEISRNSERVKHRRLTISYDMHSNSSGHDDGGMTVFYDDYRNGKPQKDTFHQKNESRPKDQYHQQNHHRRKQTSSGREKERNVNHKRRRRSSSPDLTGHRWQPFVSLRKNPIVEEMVRGNKSRVSFIGGIKQNSSRVCDDSSESRSWSSSSSDD